MNTASVLLLVILSSGPSKWDVERIVEQEKTKERERITTQIARATSELKTVPRDRDRKRRTQELKDEIAAAKKELASIDSGETIPVPRLDWLHPAAGEFGTGGGDTLHVLDVIDEKTFVAEVEYSKSTFTVGRTKSGQQYPRQKFEPATVETPFLIVGMDTADLVDGKRTYLEGTWAFTGKRKWRGQTVFILERFSVRDALREAKQNPKTK